MGVSTRGNAHDQGLELECRSIQSQYRQLRRPDKWWRIATFIWGSDDDDPTDTKRIRFYCAPCISFGHGGRGRRRVRVLTVVILPLIFFLSLFLGKISTVEKSSASSSFESALHAYPTPRFKTFHEYPGITREVMFIPFEERTSEESTMHACPRAMLFLFHGCGRYAASFFYSPQGRKIVSMAHDAGLTVVTFRKTEELGCWNWENDGEPVLKIGRKFMMSRLKDSCGKDSDGNSTYPPVWAFGVSSGGQFIQELAAKMREDPVPYQPFVFSALNVQIMAPMDQELDLPMIFTVMDGDPRTKSSVQTMINHRTDHSGGPFKMVTTSGPKGIHPRHFYNLYKDDKRMTKALSVAIYHDLISSNIIDPTKDDQITADPRSMTEEVTLVWKHYLTAERTSMKDEETAPPFGVTDALMRPLRAEELLDADGLWLIEELNVAWDVHEVTAEGFEGVLDFFSEFGLPK